MVQARVCRCGICYTTVCSPIASAPSLGSAEIQENHGFHEIEVRFEGNDAEIVVRRYVRMAKGWKESAVMRFQVPEADPADERPSSARPPLARRSAVR